MTTVKLFDFDARFTKDYLRWCGKHQDIANDPDKIEKIFPVLYKRWMETPKKWLENRSPIEHFKRLNNVAAYMTLFIEYIKHDLTIPEPLLDCIVEKKDQAYPTLLNILYAKQPDDMDKDQFDYLLTCSIDLINEMEFKHPYIRYIQILSQVEEYHDLADALFESLKHVLFTEKNMRELLITAYKDPSDKSMGRDCILDLLSYYECDPEIIELTLQRYAEAIPEDLPFVLTKLAELQYEGVIDLCREAMKHPGLNYVDYSGIKYIIESITGEPEPETRNFEADPFYERLAKDEDENEVTK